MAEGSTSSSLTEYLNYLKREGYLRKLSSGQYSQVYSIKEDPSTVVKINFNSDIGTLYYQWCVLNKGVYNWVPNVHRVIMDGNIACVFMQRYEKSKTPPKASEANQMLMPFIKYLRKSGFSIPDKQLKCGSYPRFTRKGRGKVAGWEVIGDGVCSLDLHSGDIMWDPATKSHIFTDPIAGDIEHVMPVMPIAKGIHGTRQAKRLNSTINIQRLNYKTEKEYKKPSQGSLF